MVNSGWLERDTQPNRVALYPLGKPLGAQSVDFHEVRAAAEVGMRVAASCVSHDEDCGR
jgi:hypothetical protein